MRRQWRDYNLTKRQIALIAISLSAAAAAVVVVRIFVLLFHFEQIAACGPLSLSCAN